MSARHGPGFLGCSEFEQRVFKKEESVWISLRFAKRNKVKSISKQRPIEAPKERIVLTPEAATRQHVDYILASGSIPADLVGQYQEVATGLIAEISPLFKNLELIRIHGDCHFANLIYRPDESFFLIDLDDMVVGPPVHDLWMLLPGHLEDSLYEMELFLEGYETFRPFDRRTLALIEPLRAMRFIHFTAWCARQLEGGGFISVVPDFGSRAYWQGEIADLEDQRALIKDARPLAGGNVA